MCIPALLVVLDVDGVTRRGVTDVADPAVVHSAIKLLSTCEAKDIPVHIAFLSGTVCVGHRYQSAEEEKANSWRLQNVDLKSVFYGCFEPWLAKGWVSIHGLVGADTLRYVSVSPQKKVKEGGEEGGDAHHQDADETATAAGSSGHYEHVVTQGFEARTVMTNCRAILDVHLADIAVFAPKVAAEARRFLPTEELIEETILRWKQDPSTYEDITPSCFADTAHVIVSNVDPHFKLVVNGCAETQLAGSVELHDFTVAFHPECHYRTDLAVVDDIRQHVFGLNNIPLDKRDEFAFVGGGKAHRGELPFRFVVVTRTHKGLAAAQIRKDAEESLLVMKNESEKARNTHPPQSSDQLRTITVGDTAIDFPMHRLADLSFHVGRKEVWVDGALPKDEGRSSDLSSSSQTKEEEEATRPMASVPLPILGKKEDPPPIKHLHLVLGKDGQDMQITEGTAKVLDAIALTIETQQSPGSRTQERADEKQQKEGEDETFWFDDILCHFGDEPPLQSPLLKSTRRLSGSSDA